MADEGDRAPKFTEKRVERATAEVGEGPRVRVGRLLRPSPPLVPEEEGPRFNPGSPSDVAGHSSPRRPAMEERPEPDGPLPPGAPPSPLPAMLPALPAAKASP